MPPYIWFGSTSLWWSVPLEEFSHNYFWRGQSWNARTLFRRDSNSQPPWYLPIALCSVCFLSVPAITARERLSSETKMQTFKRYKSASQWDGCRKKCWNSRSPNWVLRRPAVTKPPKVSGGANAENRPVSCPWTSSLPGRKHKSCQSDPGRGVG